MNVLSNYTANYNAALENCPEILYLQSQYDFFRKLKPLAVAIKGFNFPLNQIGEGWHVYR